MPEIQPATLLVVDDDREGAQLIAALFEPAYQVLQASSGEMALDLAVVAAPDAILLDIVMPGMDGFDCCARLKADPRTAHIPVIFMTGIDRPDAENRGLELGAADFVAKPLNPVVLEKRVQIQVELKRARDRLTMLADTDGLTGLANRRHFDEVLSREFGRLARTCAELSLMLIDIDHFKPFNDRYGHVRGDACLQAVARAIDAALYRPADMAARYGGEEFACILPDTGASGALVIAARVRAAVDRLQVVHEDSTTADFVTVSVGIAGQRCTPGGSGRALIERADRQLYLAKQAGRNRISSATAA